MNFVLTTFVTLVSVMSLADIPRPHVEPGPTRNADAESLNVLFYGAPAIKLAELKKGSNTIVVQVQAMAPSVTRYIYTSRNCSYGIAGNMCLENKQMIVTKTETVIPDHKSVTYQVSEVVKLR